jgi:hypothetical protein
MKKLKLTTSPASDFTFIGISCHLKDFKMAFQLNNSLGISLKRVNDFTSPDHEDRLYPFFICYNQEERKNFMLISNHHPDGRLLPKLKNFDFFLVADDVLPSARLSNLLSGIRKTEKVLMAVSISRDNLKEYDRITSDIELHLLENK